MNLIFFFFFENTQLPPAAHTGIYGPLSAGHILIVQDFARCPQRTEWQMSGEEIQIPGQTFKIIAKVDILWKREQPMLSLRLPRTKTNPHGLNIHLNIPTNIIKLSWCDERLNFQKMMTGDRLHNITFSKSYVETYPQYINRLIILCIEHIVLLIILIGNKTRVASTIYIKNKFAI